ncbi:MAG: metallo-beta-lactamase family protein [Candidatus Peribacteria bacterium]|nr:metallo-beta-lactamase family protein [Candidatus Peribacteria bacterium]
MLAIRYTTVLSMPSRSSLSGLLVSLILAALTGFGGYQISLLPDGKLHAYFLDVGQGDSIFLVSPSGKQILVDGGPDLSTLEQMAKHMPFFDKSIDLVILTHPDKDHISAFPEVLKRYNVKQVMLTGVEHSIGQYDAFIDAISRQQIPVLLADPKKDIRIGDGLVLDIIWPNAATMDPHTVTNATSIVMRVLYKQHSILLTGDIEKVTENQILATGAYIHSDILKVAHHGSKTSSSTGFLLAVSPQLAVISVGKDNQFGHPSPSVITRYAAMHIPVRTTMDEGTIGIVLE